MKSKILVSIISALINLGVLFSASTTHAFIKCSELSQDYKFSDLSGIKIETERLIITPTVEEDLDKLSEYLLDKDVTKYLDPSPTIRKGFGNKEESLKFLKSESPSEFIDNLEFTIKLKDNNLPIGKLDLMLYGKSTVEIGYWLGKDFQGKGYMSEASFEFCNMAFKASDVKMLYICCDIANESSSKLAIKISDYIERSNDDINLSLNIGIYSTCGTVEGEKIVFDYFQLTLQKN